MPNNLPLPETSLAVLLVIGGSVLALRGSLITSCVILLVAGCCFGYHFTTFKLGWLTLTFDRALFAVLAGVAIQQRWSGRIGQTSIASSDVALGLLLAVLIVSTFTADWRDPGPGGARPVGRLFTGYLLPATLYWIARQSAQTERRVDVAMATLLGFGFYLATTGLFEVTQQWSLVFPRYIANPIGLAFGCARGPMLQPVSFGVYVAVGLLIAWLWRARFGRAGWWIVGAALPLFLAALFFTYTRSVWLGTALGLFTVSALTLPRRWRPLVLSGMVAVSLFVVTVKWDALLSFQRGTESAAATRQSAFLRLSLAYVSWHMFLDRPWWGVHFGHFPEAKLPYLMDRSTSLDLEGLRHLTQHNLFLSLLTETGVVGLSLFLALLVCWTRKALRTWRDPRAADWLRKSAALFLGALALYVGQWLFHELSFAPIDHGLLFMLAGIFQAPDVPCGACSIAQGNTWNTVAPPRQARGVKPR